MGKKQLFGFAWKFKNYFLGFFLEIKYFLGEKLLLCIILFGGLVVTALMVTVQFNFEDRLRIVTNLCRAPSAIELRTLTEYQISRGIEFATTSPFKFAIITMVLSMTIAQILCYVAIASYIYNHDNSATTRRILSAGVIRERNRTNAITLFGQLCTFLLQMAMYGIWQKSGNYSHCARLKALT